MKGATFRRLAIARPRPRLTAADRLYHYDLPSAGVDGNEVGIQLATRTLIARQMPRVMVFAVPNGAKRSRWAATNARREGIMAGVADLCCIWAGGNTGWLEIKPRSGHVSEEQHDWLNRMAGLGHRVAVVRLSQSCCSSE
ncbi:MAG TPA: VRR-NUC domain-containing protein, partial [Novosphingobium sp.]|nr:VRR-NUC domain-containing protein [Novosphingobium sp.]